MLYNVYIIFESVIVMKKDMSVDDYINVAKTDIYLYIVILIVLFLVLLYISYRVNWYYLLLFDGLFLISVFRRIITYRNLKKIKEYLISKKIINKIGKIDFWNEKHYFLTEKYMIIIENNIVDSFEYSDISSIPKEVNYNFKTTGSYFPDYLCITLNNKKQYKILIFANYIVSDNLRDISSYLLEKNKNIIIKEDIIKVN